MFNVIVWTARILVAAVFIFAGGMKIVDPEDFTWDIQAYQMPIPYLMAAMTALFLPWLEIFCGLAILTGRLIHGACLLLFGMIVVFNVGIISVWVRGIKISCGCFGDTGIENYGLHLAMNSFLAGCLVFIFLFMKADKTQPSANFDSGNIGP